MRQRYVAVSGPAQAEERVTALAEEVGRLLAEAGCVVLTGGGGGVMAAAASGAVSAGGVAVGLLPGGSRDDGDPAHTLLIPTGLGELRNGVLVRAADAVIAVGGSWGTASEIALAARTGVPVVVLAGWALPPQGVGHPGDPLTAESPAEAVALARGSMT